MGVKRAIIGPERTADPMVPVRVVYAPMLEHCHEPQTVVSPLVRASLALHNEGALLPFLAGDATPVDVMYRLSGVRAELYSSESGGCYLLFLSYVGLGESGRVWAVFVEARRGVGRGRGVPVLLLAVWVVRGGEGGEDHGSAACGLIFCTCNTACC